MKDIPILTIMTYCDMTDPTECHCSCSEVVKKEAVVCLVMLFKAGDPTVKIQLTT